MARDKKAQTKQDYTCAILTENLWRVYKVGAIEVPALRGLSLNIEPGRFVALKGRSGSGKTTLLNCLSGLDKPTSGTVRVLGNDLMTMNDQQLTRWRREHLGFVFQSFGLLPTLSAYENVELMLRIKGIGGRERHDRTVYCLDLVGLTKWSDHRPYELSGGQQQRVAIARALANSPELILADEPTGELDSETSREILGLFARIVNEEKVTVLMASHDSLVDEYVDTILQLRDGQIVEQVNSGQ
ncbi:MAG TPA: ABC transporter ATP-binding protein [Anaerolineae bacterium]|nr:ABC transporter ATP-binding protein [Anaerolineae bacterium]HQK15038.1 ABC transporter ATP-binding protein [Anaerolineae bacterium]